MKWSTRKLNGIYSVSIWMVYDSKEQKKMFLFSDLCVYEPPYERINFFSLNYIELNLNLRMLSFVTIGMKINHHRQQKVIVNPWIILLKTKNNLLKSLMSKIC